MTFFYRIMEKNYVWTYETIFTINFFETIAQKKYQFLPFKKTHLSPYAFL